MQWKQINTNIADQNRPSKISTTINSLQFLTSSESVFSLIYQLTSLFWKDCVNNLQTISTERKAQGIFGGINNYVFPSFSAGR